MSTNTNARVWAGFILLFFAYHAAEYMILFRNSSFGFLGFQLLFFLLSYLIARWQGFSGLAAWGMTKNFTAFRNFGIGLLAGTCWYTLYFLTSLLMDFERIEYIPGFRDFVPQFLLYFTGSFFSSLSEDILTRGYLYRHLKGIAPAGFIVLFSALIYVLNHIYRLDDGPTVWLYLLITGIFLAIAMVKTGNIWLAAGVHWAGNIVYHTTNSVMHTKTGYNIIPGIYLYILFLLALIPISAWLAKWMARPLISGIHPERF